MSDFDPSSIPAFPVIHLKVTTDEDGTHHGQVDGQPVPVDQDDPIASLMHHARSAAATRPLRAVRVSATDATDTTWLMAVHADGRTWDVDRPGAQASSGRISRRAAAATAVGVLAAATLGLGAAWAISSRQEPPPPTPTAAPAGESPVVPAQGWARRAAWVSPTLADTGDEPAVLPTGRAVITTVATKNGDQVAGLRPRDGATLWTTDLPDGSGPVQMTSYRHREAIAAAGDGSLTIWPNNGRPGAPPHPTTWDFPESGLELVDGAPVPILASEESDTALVLDGKRLEKRVLPAGATPITGDENGHITAVDETGHWWTLTSKSTAPSPALLEPPKWGAEVEEVIGLAGRTLIVSWSTKDDEVVLAGYATENQMKPVWTTTVPDRPTSDDMHVSPDGSWATVGTTAVNTESGRTRSLPDDWQTLGITNEAAWSTEAVAKKLGQAHETATELEDPTGVPIDTTKKGLGLIVAAKNNGSTSRIYALEPDPGHPYDAGKPIPAQDAEKKDRPDKAKNGDKQDQTDKKSKDDKTDRKRERHS